MNTDVLTERQNTILNAVIESYIYYCEPLGSRTLAKKYNIGVSPATIRNEMSDLEDLGYLMKSHISSGRIPSDLAYRLYVQRIFRLLYHKFKNQTALAVSSKIQNTPVDSEKMLRSAAKVLSELTGYTTVSMAARPEKMKIAHLELVPINDEDYVLVNLYDNGEVSNTRIHLQGYLRTEELKKINFYLNHFFRYVEIRELREAFEAFKLRVHDFILQDFIEHILLSESVQESKVDIEVEGLSQIFNFPEYEDIEKVKKFITFVGNDQKMARLFENGGRGYLDIRIGSENVDEELKENTVMMSHYFIGHEPIGKICLIAPTRMQYSRTIDAMLKMAWKINTMGFLSKE